MRSLPRLDCIQLAAEPPSALAPFLDKQLAQHTLVVGGIPHDAVAAEADQARVSGQHGVLPPGQQPRYESGILAYVTSDARRGLADRSGVAVGLERCNHTVDERPDQLRQVRPDHPDHHRA